MKTILPLIGVLIGWILSEYSKMYSDKKQDKRKLRKLLYFLLELRFHFENEFSMEVYIDKFLKLYKAKLITKFNINDDVSELDNNIGFLKPVILELISKNKAQDNKVEYLTGDIDKVLFDLAEVLPILAYELSGQHNIKERLNKVNNYFSDIENMAAPMPINLKELINPKLTKELLDDLDESIKKIAARIDKKTLRGSINKIAKMKRSIDEEEVNRFIDEMLDKLKESNAILS